MVANFDAGTIGEFGLDGSTINAALISGLDGPLRVAVSPVPEPSSYVLAGLAGAALWVWRRMGRQAGRA